MVTKSVRDLARIACGIVLESRRVQELNIQERFNEAYAEACHLGDEALFKEELYSEFRNIDEKSYDNARKMAQRARKWMKTQ
mgnify:CR=1 FL=1